MIHFLGFLAWRSLQQHRLRTLLSALAVALGVAMTLAAGMVGQSILSSVAASEDAQTMMGGLLNEFDSVLSMTGVVITGAAGFLVFNAFAMSITQRRQQMGALRSLGMTRGQVMRLVLVEALITAGLGTLAGLIAGPLLARATTWLVETTMGEGTFVFARSQVYPSRLVLAAALGIGITLLSALAPGWQASRISPLTALRQTIKPASPRSTRRSFSLGLVGMVVTLAYLALFPPGEWIMPPWDIPATGLFVLLWLCCLVLVLPGFVAGVGRRVRRPLARLWGATGRLIADNVRRERGRVMLTILTLSIGLAMIAGMTGFMRFTFSELMLPRIEAARHQQAWMLTQFVFEGGMASYADLTSLLVSPDLVAEVRENMQGRASVIDWEYVTVPELGFFNADYFSFIIDPHEVQRAGDWVFEFTAGDWETALPIMEQGCGVLIMPLVASRNGVSTGDTFEVTGADGPVACTVAGVGSTYVGASIISSAAEDSFGITDPLVVLITPLPGVDRDALEADLAAVVGRHPGAYLEEFERLAEIQFRMQDTLPAMLNALLFLAIVAAALGMVNTTVMSVAERRRELSLLRAVGATRRQVAAVVAGEAALMGVIGGLGGLVAGVGGVVILAVTYGGNAWGVPNLDLWRAACRSALPSLLSGLAGLIVAPIVCAAAAWLPARAFLRESPLKALDVC